MTESIPFPPHQGLPFDYRAPIVDGFSEWELGVPTAEIETGWEGATRLTFAGASGVPAASFQALKHKSEPFIYLSFVVRLDLEFNDNDAILLVFQPTFNDMAHDANTRRLLIRPNFSPVGAGAGDPLPHNTGSDLTSTTTGPGGSIRTIPIRTNRLATNTFSSWNTATSSWTNIPNTGVGSIQNYEIRARSWKVNDSDLDWSVEIKLPTTKNAVNGFGGGGANWIDIQNTFGFYFNVFRFSTQPTIINSGFATEFIWPRVNAPITDMSPGGPFASLTAITIPAAAMGQGLLSGDGQGVFFDGGWNSIGVESGGSVIGTIDATAGVTNTMIAKLKNSSTTDDALGVNATFRLANFGIGSGNYTSWALIDPHSATTPAPNNTNPTTRVTVSKNNGTAALRMKWPLNAADRKAYTGHGYDQCLWVVLDSDQNATFIESSYRRNLAFANLSSVEKEPTVSGRDHGPTPDGGPNHDFLLITSQRLLVSTQNYDGWIGRPPSGTPRPDTPPVIARGANLRVAGDGEGDYNQSGKTAPALANEIFGRWNSTKDITYTWIAVTAAFRRTGETLTLGGVSHALYQPVDSYSYVLTHEGNVQEFRKSLTGPGLKRLGEGIYQLPVPDGGEVVLNERYEAVEAGGTTPKGCLLLLLGILISALKALVGALESIYKSLKP